MQQPEKEEKMQSEHEEEMQIQSVTDYNSIKPLVGKFYDIVEDMLSEEDGDARNLTYGANIRTITDRMKRVNNYLSYNIINIQYNGDLDVQTLRPLISLAEYQANIMERYIELRMLYNALYDRIRLSSHESLEFQGFVLCGQLLSSEVWTYGLNTNACLQMYTVESVCNGRTFDFLTRGWFQESFQDNLLNLWCDINDECKKSNNTDVDDHAADAKPYQDLYGLIHQNYLAIQQPAEFNFVQQRAIFTSRQSIVANTAVAPEVRSGQVAVAEEQAMMAEQQQQQRRQEQAEQQQQQMRRQDVTLFEKISKRTPANFSATLTCFTKYRLTDLELKAGVYCRDNAEYASIPPGIVYYTDFYVMTLVRLFGADCNFTQGSTAVFKDLLNSIERNEYYASILQKLKAEHNNDASLASLVHEWNNNKDGCDQYIDDRLIEYVRQLFETQLERDDHRSFTFPAMLKMLAEPDLMQALLHGDALPAGFIVCDRDGEKVITYDYAMAKRTCERQKELLNEYFGQMFLQYTGIDQSTNDGIADADKFVRPQHGTNLVCQLEQLLNTSTLLKQINPETNKLFITTTDEILSRFDKNVTPEAAVAFLQSLEILQAKAPEIFQLFYNSYLKDATNWSRFAQPGYLQAFQAVTSWSTANRNFFYNRVKKHLEAVGHYDFAAFCSQFQYFLERAQLVCDIANLPAFDIPAESTLLASDDNFIQGINVAAYLLETSVRPDEVCINLLNNHGNMALRESFHQDCLTANILSWSSDVVLRSVRPNQPVAERMIMKAPKNKYVMGRAQSMSYFPSQKISDLFVAEAVKLEERLRRLRERNQENPEVQKAVDDWLRTPEGATQTNCSFFMQQLAMDESIIPLEASKIVMDLCSRGLKCPGLDNHRQKLQFMLNTQEEDPIFGEAKTGSYFPTTFISKIVASEGLKVDTKQRILDQFGPVFHFAQELEHSSSSTVIFNSEDIAISVPAKKDTTDPESYEVMWLLGLLATQVFQDNPFHQQDLIDNSAAWSAFIYCKDNIEDQTLWNSTSYCIRGLLDNYAPVPVGPLIPGSNNDEKVRTDYREMLETAARQSANYHNLIEITRRALGCIDFKVLAQPQQQSGAVQTLLESMIKELAELGKQVTDEMNRFEAALAKDNAANATRSYKGDRIQQMAQHRERVIQQHVNKALVLLTSEKYGLKLQGVEDTINMLDTATCQAIDDTVLGMCKNLIDIPENTQPSLSAFIAQISNGSNHYSYKGSIDLTEIWLNCFNSDGADNSDGQSIVQETDSQRLCIFFQFLMDHPQVGQPADQPGSSSPDAAAASSDGHNQLYGIIQQHFAAQKDEFTHLAEQQKAVAATLCGAKPDSAEFRKLEDLKIGHEYDQLGSSAPLQDADTDHAKQQSNSFYNIIVRARLRFNLLKFISDNQQLIKQQDRLPLIELLFNESNTKFLSNTHFLQNFIDIYASTKEAAREELPAPQQLLSLFTDRTLPANNQGLNLLNFTLQQVPPLNKDSLIPFIKVFSQAAISLDPSAPIDIGDAQIVLQLLQNYPDHQSLLLRIIEKQGDQADNMVHQLIDFMKRCDQIPGDFRNFSIQHTLEEMDQALNGDKNPEIPPGWFENLESIVKDPEGKEIYLPILRMADKKTWSILLADDECAGQKFSVRLESIKAYLNDENNQSQLEMLQRLAILGRLEQQRVEQTKADDSNKEYWSSVGQNTVPDEDRATLQRRCGEIYNTAVQFCFSPDYAANGEKLIKYNDQLRALELLYNDHTGRASYTKMRSVLLNDPVAESSGPSITAARSTIDDAITEGPVTFTDQDVQAYLAGLRVSLGDSQQFNPEDIDNLCSELAHLASLADRPLFMHPAFEFVGGADFFKPNSLDPKYHSLRHLNDAQLVRYCNKLAELLREGKYGKNVSLRDDLIHELLLGLAENSFRTTGKYPYLHQLVCNLLHAQSHFTGKQPFFNLSTGGGKSLVIATNALFDYLVASNNSIVWITTATQVLAKRDGNDLTRFASMFNIPVEVVTNSQKPPKLTSGAKYFFVSDENAFTLNHGLLNQQTVTKQATEQFRIYMHKDEVDKGMDMDVRDTLVGASPVESFASRIHNPRENLYDQIYRYYRQVMGELEKKGAYTQQEQKAAFDQIINQLYKDFSPEQLDGLARLSPPNTEDRQFIHDQLSQTETKIRTAEEQKENEDRQSEKDVKTQLGLLRLEYTRKAALDHFVTALYAAEQIWRKEPADRGVKLAIKPVLELGERQDTLSYRLLSKEGDDTTNVYNQEQHMMFSTMLRHLVQDDKLTEADYKSLPAPYNDKQQSAAKVKALPVYFGPDMQIEVTGKATSSFKEAAHRSKVDTQGQYCVVVKNGSYSGTNIAYQTGVDFYQNINGAEMDIPTDHGGVRQLNPERCVTKQTVKELCRAAERAIKADLNQDKKTNKSNSKKDNRAPVQKTVSLLMVDYRSKICLVAEYVNKEFKDLPIYIETSAGVWQLYPLNGHKADSLLSDDQLTAYLKNLQASEPTPILISNLRSSFVAPKQNKDAKVQFSVALHTDIDQEKKEQNREVVKLLTASTPKMQGSILFSRDAINAHAAAQAFMNYLVDEDNAEVRNKLSRPYRLFQRRLDGDGYDCYLLAENATEFVLDNPQTCGFDDYPAVIQELRTQGCYSATFADLSAGRGMDAQLDQAVLLDVETDPEIYRQIIGRVARGKNNGLVSHLYTMTDLIEQVGDPSNEEEYQLKKWRKQDYTTDRIQQKRNNVGSIKARKIQAGYILNYYCSSLIELLTMIQDFLPPGNEESLNAAANSVKQMAANLNTADWNTAQIAQKVEELWQTFSEVTQQAGLLNSEDGCEYLQLNFDPSNNINKNLAQQTMDGVETYSVINAKLYALHPNTFMCYQQSLSQFSQSTPAALTTYDRRCLLGGEWAVFSELVNKQWCQYNANLAKLVHACNSVMASEDGQALNASLQAIADLLNNPDDSCYTQSLIILSVLSHGSENKRNQRLQTALRKLLAESTEPNSQLELDSNARFAICQALSDDCYQSCSDMLSTSSNRKTQVPPRGVIKDLKQQLVLDGYLDIRTAKQDTIADNLKKRLDVIFNMNNCAINANEDQHSKLRKAYYVKCLELFNEGKLGAVNTTVTVNIDGTVYECSLPAKSDWLLSVTQLQARPYSSNPFKYFFQRCFGLQREPTQAAMNFQQYLRHEAGLDQPSASAQLELKSAQEGESAQLAVT